MHPILTYKDARVEVNLELTADEFNFVRRICQGGLEAELDCLHLLRYCTEHPLLEAVKFVLARCRDEPKEEKT